ncbi:unnamed protein product [Brassica oleracea var. botrytis]
MVPSATNCIAVALASSMDRCHLCIVLLIKHRAKQLWGSLNKHKASLVVLLLESKAVLSSSSSSEGKLRGPNLQPILITSIFWDGTQESEPVLDCDIL